MTVIAPTGTIGFMMDCDTTGVEPDLALVKYKKLVGGGVIKIVNNTVPQALIKSGTTPQQVERDRQPHRCHRHHRRRAAPQTRASACLRLQLPAQNGTRSIHYMGHLRMMARCSRSSRARSQRPSTCRRNRRSRTSGCLHRELAARAEGGRDLPRRFQARPAADYGSAKAGRRRLSAADGGENRLPALRRRLPDERHSITHKFSIGGHEGYITVGLFEDGTPGETFITMAKEGSTISGLMDSFATAVSYRSAVRRAAEVLRGQVQPVRFEPSGWTGNPQVPYAKSIMDYIFRWLGAKFLGPEYALTEAGETPKLRPTETEPQQALPFETVMSDAPLCANAARS